ncbi:hypothetical protein TRFO_10487 [Tritrichomonas foetus]|uniref:Uncharacterized protein n=1 Tax=Tritrichomonas foetus TaxID=1144522 RepID=A0A1J4JE95_9EUKA|nr:hypothetical protein TRFO_10487 [Tritrichomonas foetus]|eukprot:OHS95580.1 hypothetical protein TRFO_10487 [Tritrichomonas foetus]
MTKKKDLDDNSHPPLTKHNEKIQQQGNSHTAKTQIISTFTQEGGSLNQTKAKNNQLENTDIFFRQQPVEKIEQQQQFPIPQSQVQFHQKQNMLNPSLNQVTPEQNPIVNEQLRKPIQQPMLLLSQQYPNQMYPVQSQLQQLQQSQPQINPQQHSIQYQLQQHTTNQIHPQLHTQINPQIQTQIPMQQQIQSQIQPSFPNKLGITVQSTFHHQIQPQFQPPFQSLNVNTQTNSSNQSPKTFQTYRKVQLSKTSHISTTVKTSQVSTNATTSQGTNPLEKLAVTSFLESKISQDSKIEDKTLNPTGTENNQLHHAPIMPIITSLSPKHQTNEQNSFNDDDSKTDESESIKAHEKISEQDKIEENLHDV